LVLTIASKPAQGRGNEGIAGGMKMPSLPWAQNRWMMARTCSGGRHMVFARTGDGQESTGLMRATHRRPISSSWTHNPDKAIGKTQDRGNSVCTTVLAMFSYLLCYTTGDAMVA
jgi:hypothetical protein